MKSHYFHITGKPIAFIFGLLIILSKAIGGEFVVENKIVNYPVNGNAFIGTVHTDGTMPSNWASPDDYYHGTFYAYYEVLSVPTSVKFGMQIGLFQYYPSKANFDGVNYNENCSDVVWLQGTGSTATYSGTPATWWKMGGRDVDFSRVYDFESVGAVIWGSNPDSPLSPTNGGGDDATYAQQANWFPCSVKVIIVAVSAGSTFSGWDHYLNGGGSGGKQPTPVYGINYSTEKTDKSVPSTDEYSYSSTMSNAVIGKGTALTLTPGQDVYFQTLASGDLLASDIQHLVVPSRPTTPSVSINYVSEKTAENITSDLEYSASASYTNVQTGSGVPVTVVPGQDLYFWKKYTSSSFYSDVFHLVSPSRPALVYSGPDTITSALFTVQVNVNGLNGFDLNHLSVSNGTAQNLHSGNLFDVVPAGSGTVQVSIPANAFTGGSFASNRISVYYKTSGTSGKLPTPSYSIDYVNEKTTNSVPATDEYANNAGMSGAVSGTGQKLTLTPGQDVYFRTKANTSLSVSDVFHLVCPERPEMPEFSIDYVHEKTVEIVPSTMAYTNTPTYTNVHDGAGTQLAVIPGQTLYIWIKPTSSSFSSFDYHLVAPARNTLLYTGSDTIHTDHFTVKAVMADQSVSFKLSGLAITNGTAGNLQAGNTFDITPATAGQVTAIISANALSVNSFASNKIAVYYQKNTTGTNLHTGDPLKLYPNPTHDGWITIGSELVLPCTITVYSATGNFVQNIRLTEENAGRIDLHNLPKGMYVISVQAKNLTAMVKLIIL